MLPAEIWFLDVPSVRRIHDAILLPDEPVGIRYLHLLESAVASPQVGHLKGYYNNNLFEMAAALTIGLACNHAFENGNKRTAVVCCIIFLQANHYRITMKNTPLRDMVISVAKKTLNKSQLARLLLKKSTRARFTGSFDPPDVSRWGSAG